MRILITGITGYIGSHLARALLPSHTVYGLVREPVKDTYIHSFRDSLKLVPYDGTYQSMEKAIQESRPELVYHLAAYYTGTHGKGHTPQLVQSNITLGVYLLEALSAYGKVPLVCASSVMGHYHGKEYCPLNLYAATKKAFADLLAYYTDAGLLRAITLVLSDTYGPNDSRSKVLNLIQSAIRSGEYLALTSGEQDYDAVYIDDVVRAFRLAGKRLAAQDGQENEIFQISSLHPLSLRETVEIMLKTNHLDFQAGWGERAYAEREIFKAIRVYQSLPGWQPEVPLEKGLYCLWHCEETDTFQMLS